MIEIRELFRHDIYLAVVENCNPVIIAVMDIHRTPIADISAIELN